MAVEGLTFNFKVRIPSMAMPTQRTQIRMDSIALSEAARDAKWLQALYDELGFSQKGPTLLLGDNNDSIAMANNSQFHKRSKHIEIRHHWIREQIQQLARLPLH